MTPVRSILPAFIAGLLALAFVTTPAARGAEEDSPLLKAMEEMGDHYKAMKKIIKDPSKNAETLALIDKSLQAALTSKLHLPKMMEKVPAADKPKMIAGYRKMMGRVIAMYVKLEAEIVDGKNEEAAETLKALHDLEEEGHEIYNP